MKFYFTIYGQHLKHRISQSQNQVNCDSDLQIFFLISMANALSSWRPHYFKLAMLNPIKPCRWNHAFGLEFWNSLRFRYVSKRKRPKNGGKRAVNTEWWNDGGRLLLFRAIGSVYREAEPLMKGRSTTVLLLKNQENSGNCFLLVRFPLYTSPRIERGRLNGGRK